MINKNFETIYRNLLQTPKTIFDYVEINNNYDIYFNYENGKIFMYSEDETFDKENLYVEN